MNSMLTALAQHKGFVTYRLAPLENGKVDKLPINPFTGHNSNAQDAATWMTPDLAQAFAAEWAPAYTDGTGVGIVIYEGSQLFCIDIDGCVIDGGINEFAQRIIACFPGAVVEVSQSGKGIHIFGMYKGILAPHKTKNTHKHIELYTKARFIALTGNFVLGHEGYVGTDCTEALTAFAAEYFPKPEGDYAGEWTDKPADGWDFITDDAELLAWARNFKNSKSIFGFKAPIHMLLDADPDLGKWYPSVTGQPYDASSADQAAANFLAWATGNNAERVERLMRMTKLAEGRDDKWGRDDYFKVTVAKGCTAKAPWPTKPRVLVGTPTAHAASGVRLISATSIQPEAIDWLWHSHLARGKLSILAGVAGTGKSTVAFNLASTVSTGGVWPDGSKCPSAGNVLIWSGEDNPADTIIPRLMAASASLDRIHIITGGKAEDGTQLPFDPATDIPRLREEITRIGGAALMVIDPIVSAVSGDMHKANDVRRGLQAVIDLSAAFDCSVIGISHFSKGSKGASPQERVIGSQAFAALARLVLVCAKNEDGDTRVLMRAKSNISLDHGGFNYNIAPATIQTPHGAIETTNVEWGEALEGSARDILSEMEDEADQKTDKSAVCMEALRAILCGAEGNPVEMLCTDVEDHLKSEGHTPKVIRTARERLKVAIRREGFGPGSKLFWRLPADAMTVGSAMIPAATHAVGATGPIRPIAVIGSEAKIAR